MVESEGAGWAVATSMTPSGTRSALGTSGTKVRQPAGTDQAALGTPQAELRQWGAGRGAP